MTQVKNPISQFNEAVHRFFGKIKSLVDCEFNLIFLGPKGLFSPRMFTKVTNLLRDCTKVTPPQKAFIEALHQIVQCPNYSSVLTEVTPLPTVLISLITVYTSPELHSETKTLHKTSSKHGPPQRTRMTYVTTHTLLFGVRHGPYITYCSSCRTIFDEVSQGPIPSGPESKPTFSGGGFYHQGSKIGLEENGFLCLHYLGLRLVHLGKEWQLFPKEIPVDPLIHGDFLALFVPLMRERNYS